jgi:UDP-N-acetylmuramoyl-tripeptide--D-alanyl-D-alanine ligase
MDRPIQLVVATGAFAAAARALGVPSDRVLIADEWRAAYPELRKRLRGDEVVLLKASRGIALEAVLPLLEADFGQRTADV